jgi:hypothetical protein
MNAGLRVNAGDNVRAGRIGETRISTLLACADVRSGVALNMIAVCRRMRPRQAW